MTHLSATVYQTINSVQPYPPYCLQQRTVSIGAVPTEQKIHIDGVIRYNNSPSQRKQKRTTNTMKTATSRSPSPGWLNTELNTLTKYKSNLFDEDQRVTAERLLNKQVNQVSFYTITPRRQLPKSLQKMSFQTMNTKQLSGTSIVKVYRKQPLTYKENQVRKVLKQHGKIMTLSEIYDFLDDPLEERKAKEAKLMHETLPLSNIVNQLDEWQKTASKKSPAETRRSKIKLPTLGTTDELSCIGSRKKELAVKKFKLGFDYRSEVEKNLEVINTSHEEANPIAKYLQIESSSKLLKRELEEMQKMVQREVQDNRKKLTQARKQHHRLYEQKLVLQISEQDHHKIRKSQETGIQGLMYPIHSPTNPRNVHAEKRSEMERNQLKISKIKKSIEYLEEEQLKSQEQLKNIMKAQTLYYETSLKNGLDCRETGLVWVIKKLGLKEEDLPLIEFPDYLDKRSKHYLVLKAQSEDALEQLIKQKKQFVNEIGAARNSEFPGSKSPHRRSSKNGSMKLIKLDKQHLKTDCVDCVKQPQQRKNCDCDIPKRYNRSMRKITALREEFLQNENLLKFNQSRSTIKLGKDLTGLTGRQLYNSITEKIRQVDFSKLRLKRGQQRSNKIQEYQTILKRIQGMHMQIEEQDLQHENHLLTQYKGSRELFFTLAAACFGIKRAYSLIIKNFSWKNSG